MGEASEVELVKKLRNKTGAGMMDCRSALMESQWDLEKALQVLRRKGHEIAQRKSSRVTKAGRIESYIHAGYKIGVLIEVNCETDFVARTEDFGRLVRDLAMQVAATSARWIDRSDVPSDIVEQEKALYQEGAKGKPESVIPRVVEGKLVDFFRNVCLLEQPFIKNDKITVRELLTEAIAKTGENINVKRFVKFQLGE